jgi:hypothetical protein
MSFNTSLPFKLPKKKNAYSSVHVRAICFTYLIRLDSIVLMMSGSVHKLQGFSLRWLLNPSDIFPVQVNVFPYKL